jgi:hypothetical protein
MAHGCCVANGASGKPGDIPEYIALLALGALLVRTLYFSHTRGIKMDTTEKELKHGAIADLLY